jgi:hypothetical protein
MLIFGAGMDIFQPECRIFLSEQRIFIQENSAITTAKKENSQSINIDLLFRTRDQPKKLHRKDAFVLHLGCLTVCVTRAGAGGGTPSDWKNAEA